MAIDLTTPRAILPAQTKPKCAELLEDPIIRLPDFLELKVKPPELVIDPWLPAQGLAMLSGPSGVGKTLLGLQIAYAVAAGQPVVPGWKVPKARPTVYVEGELPVRTVQDRLRAITAGRPSQVPEMLGIISALYVKRLGGLPDLSTPEGQTWLDARLKAFGNVEVIILDSITTLMPTQEQLDGDDWRARVQGWLLEHRRHGHTVLLLHHDNKAGSQNGTEQRTVPLDTAVALKRPEGYDASQGARFVVEFTKSRGFWGENAKPFELTYRVDVDRSTWIRNEVSGSPTGHAARNKVAIAEETVERMQALAAQGKTRRQIAELLNLSQGAVQRSIKTNGKINGGSPATAT